MDGPLQPNDPPNPPAGMRANILAYWQDLTDGLANVPVYWQQFTDWCSTQKKFWLYTKGMKVADPLGVSYSRLEAFYSYSGAFFLVNNAIPWMLVASWYLVGFACTWHPSRQYLPQDLCSVPGFPQRNDSSWPIDRFYQTNGSEQGAARYLKSVMVGPTALADHTIAVRQQRRKIEMSPHSQAKHLPANLKEIEELLQGFNPKFERFSSSLCNALDDIDHGFWTFVRIFNQYTASTDDFSDVSWISLLFYPWHPVARWANAQLHTTYLPAYRPDRGRTVGEIIYEFNRFFVRSMKALDDMDRDFLARDFPAFLGKMTPVLETHKLLIGGDSSQMNWRRNEELRSSPLYQLLAWKFLGVGHEAVDSLDHYRALYIRNRDRLRDINDALHTWKTYLDQLREQLLTLRHLFYRKTTALDLLSQRALIDELKHLRREKYPKEAAGGVRFSNVMHFNVQIGRLHDLIAGVGVGREGEGCGCAAEMQRARRAYEVEMGINPEAVVSKLLKAHKDWKKGTPLPDHW